MRDPNDTRFIKASQMMASGNMIGLDRPVGRITWAKEGVKVVQSQLPAVGHLRYIQIADAAEHEIVPDTITINRSIDQDSATCTITVSNVYQETSRPEGLDTENRAGYYSPGRGDKTPKATSIYEFIDAVESKNGKIDLYPTSWKYPQNKYRDVFIPNTVIRTYQGYGSDNFDTSGNEHDVFSTSYVAPQDDSQLYLTGIWLIDKITFNASALTMTIECRDLAKLLIEQIIYPPLVPIDRFPLIYCPAHGAFGHHGGKKGSVGRDVGRYHSSSVDPWYGHNAKVHGHRGSDAFDGNDHSWWLSVGNGQPNEYYSYEWVQAKTHGHEVNEVYLYTKGANYSIYVSVMEGGVWKGTNTVPYEPVPPGFPNGSNIKYVKHVTQGSGTKITIRLPRTYKADYVRVCFTNLQNLGYNGYPYRAGVRTMVVRNNTTVIIKDTFKPAAPDGSIGQNGVRFIKDWSEPIKELCAWGGFTWPDATPNPADPLLGKSKAGKPLRVWGDFESMGAGPIVCTPGDFFISKSFMDGIRQICDFLGCIFFVDEYGGANFRLPNIWSVGSFITDPEGHFLDARIKRFPIEFHENANLIDYSVTLDDSQLRSEVLVVGNYPSVTAAAAPVAGGVVLAGNNGVDNKPTSAIDFTNILAGQYRLMAVPGDSTTFIYTQEECQRMAELVGLFMLFSYRSSNVHAPCHPGLQIDDQVRIFERTTYEYNVHYVSGISTSMDLTAGSWTMDVTTHWLGQSPDTKWFVNKKQLTPAVKNLPAIIKRIGLEAGGDVFEQPPYGV